MAVPLASRQPLTLFTQPIIRIHRRKLPSRISIQRQSTHAPSASAPPEPPSSNSTSTADPDAVSHALRDTNATENNLLAPVHLPEDPHGVLNARHPAAKILANSAIVVQRRMEMMNLVLGFEQANKYVIMDPRGQHLGYMAERELGMGNMMARQWFRTHRSFTTHVFDREMKEVLRFHRPFSWISSRIRVYDPLEVNTASYSSSTALQSTAAGSLSTDVSDLAAQVSPLSLADMRIIGEAQQEWAPLRRKYNLFLHSPSPEYDLSTSSLQSPSPASQRREGNFDQFAYVDERFLSWDFSLISSSQQLIGSVNRNFAGLGREIFTDTGVYALRMDAVGLAEEPNHLISKTGQQIQTAYTGADAGMSLDQRAVVLATAVSVDFDYFSRNRSGVMGFMPMWLGGAGGDAAGGAAAGGAAAGGVAAGEAAGGVAVGEAATGALGGAAARGAGSLGGLEGAAVAGGSMAGYGAAQRSQSGNDISSDGNGSGFGAGQSPPDVPTNGQVGEGEEVWGEGGGWSEPAQRSGGGGEGSGDGGDGDGGGGIWDAITDFFED